MNKSSYPLIIILVLLALSCGKDDPIDLGSDDKAFSQDLSGYYYNPPTLLNNHIFIGTSHRLFDEPRNANFMFKLDMDLNKVWEYSLANTEVRGSASIDSQGNVYFVVQTGHASDDMTNAELFLYSLTPDGQTLRWQYKIMDVGNVLGIGMMTPAITIDDKVIVGGDKIHSFDIDGNLLWSYSPQGSSLSCMNTPIIDNVGNIYFNYSGGSASLQSDGTERWKVENWDGGRSCAAFTYDYSKVIMPRGSTVFCFDAATGNIIWQFTPNGMQGSFRASPAVDDEGNVYIGTKADEESVLYAIRADGSGLLWSNALGADLYSSPALGNNRVLYTGSETIDDGKRFHAISMLTGEILWSKRLNTDITWSSPAISDDGTIYIACMPIEDEKGYVYAFKTDCGGLLNNAGSPCFLGSNANNGRR